MLEGTTKASSRDVHVDPAATTTQPKMAVVPVPQFNFVVIPPDTEQNFMDFNVPCEDLNSDFLMQPVNEADYDSETQACVDARTGGPSNFYDHYVTKRKKKRGRRGHVERTIDELEKRSKKADQEPAATAQQPQLSTSSDLLAVPGAHGVPKGALSTAAARRMACGTAPPSFVADGGVATAPISWKKQGSEDTPPQIKAPPAAPFKFVVLPPDTEKNFMDFNVPCEDLNSDFLMQPVNEADYDSETQACVDARTGGPSNFYDHYVTKRKKKRGRRGHVERTVDELHAREAKGNGDGLSVTVTVEPPVAPQLSLSSTSSSPSSQLAAPKETLAVPGALGVPKGSLNSAAARRLATGAMPPNLQVPQRGPTSWSNTNNKKDDDAPPSYDAAASTGPKE